MICPNCASANEAGAKYCNECGAALNAGCSNCGAINKPGAKFCNECGAAQSSSEPGQVAADSATPTVAERRLVTVLFADIVGFTPFAEERDAEDVRDTLSRYFDICSEVIVRYGGTVEKFIGDAVMAVWGAPVAHEDDAERAVRAALDLVEAVHSLGPDVEARAGVLTGEAAVTIGATNQGMVAGDLVNSAARLQSVAPAGAVLVGEATFRASSDAIAFEPTGEQLLKGKQSPVQAWRAVRVVAERGGRNRSEGLEAPFVGRADELRLLKDLFHATGRETKVRLVSVMGPAGIGKSRLAWEFLKYVDGLVENTYWHSGRSPSYGDGITFWALGEMIRGRCELLETDDEPTTRRKVSETVAQWITDEEERRWIEPALLTLLGIESDMGSEQLFGAWRTFFERISASGTVTLVFEDMHFADAGLLDFVDHMLEWSRGFPIYIVTLSRPELLDKRADWGAGKRSFTSLYLEPLSEPEMRELLTGLAPGLPAQAVAAIVERADGIPLYAVEIVRMLVADGRLVAHEGAYAPVGDLTSLAVPETLTALIASRLDGLDPSDRAVIHDAAVLGQSFTLAGLAAISGVREAELEDRLRSLLRRELLTRDVDARSPELGQFSFVQALIREVAYNTLARPDRKVRHLAAARHFEQLGSDELAGALAGHYLSAYRNATEGAEADALAGQARIALKAAAERAVALAAHDQAIVFIEQALEVTHEIAEQAELQRRAGEAARSAARTDDAERFLRGAIELYRELGDRLGVVEATSTLGVALLNARRNQEAVTLLDDALQGVADLWPHPVVVALKGVLGRGLVQTQDAKRALAVLEDVLEEAEHADLVGPLARALVSKGGALGSLGRLNEAIALLSGAEQISRERAVFDALSGALLVGGFHLGEVDARAAYEKYREGLDLTRRTGQRALMLTFINNLGYTGFIAGEWERALGEMEGVLSDDVERSHRIWLMGNSLSVRASRGEDIRARLTELEGLVEPGDSFDYRMPVLDAQANSALASGDLPAARRAWREVAVSEPVQAVSALYQSARASLWLRDAVAAREDLAGVDVSGVHGRIADLRRATIRAGLAALDGRVSEAQNGYRECVRGWHEVGMIWDEALTGLDMTLLLGPEDAIPEIVQSTREIMERLGARPFIERLDDALRSQPATATTPTLETAQPVRAAQG